MERPKISLTTTIGDLGPQAGRFKCDEPTCKGLQSFVKVHSDGKIDPNHSYLSCNLPDCPNKNIPFDTPITIKVTEE